MAAANKNASRQCWVLYGDASTTRHAAQNLLAKWPSDTVGWLAGHSSRKAHNKLGQTLAAVVVDLHAGWDGHTIAQAHGCVGQHGVLILCMPPQGQTPPPLTAHWASGYPLPQTGWPSRSWARFKRLWDGAIQEAQHKTILQKQTPWAHTHLTSPTSSIQPLLPPPHPFQPMPSQEACRAQKQWIDTTFNHLQRNTPQIHILLARRGRGKSAALGHVAASLAQAGMPHWVCVPHTNNLKPIEAFSKGAHLEALSAAELGLLGHPAAEAIVLVDEAAQFSPTLLGHALSQWPKARFVLATTIDGYEGSGMGFVHRFLPKLAHKAALGLQPKPHIATLTHPMRWQAGDRLEAWIDRLLILPSMDLLVSKQSPTLPALPTLPTLQKSLPCSQANDAVYEPIVISQEDLAADDSLLQDFYGLLAQAHYRTTPRDLDRILDAPNLKLFAMRAHHAAGPSPNFDKAKRTQLVAAMVVALEGGLDLTCTQNVLWGKTRLVGHLLPEVLVAHLGQAWAGPMRIARSVRVATLPAYRRLGLASRLVHFAHQELCDIDLWGTSFAATPAVISFRQKLGYRPVFLGQSLGARSGEPSVMCVRPVHPIAQAQCHLLAEEFAPRIHAEKPWRTHMPCENPLWDLWPADQTTSSLKHPKPLPASLEQPDAIRFAIERYIWGPSTFEATAPFFAWLYGRYAGLDRAPPLPKIAEHRLVACKSWQATSSLCGDLSPRAAMRKMRRDLSEWVNALAAYAPSDPALPRQHPSCAQPPPR